MRFYADLHIHSKYARATSRDSDLEHMALWAAKKGIKVLGTGDFTHPAWRTEIGEKLVPAEPGLFRLQENLEKTVQQQLPSSCRQSVRFMLEVEISTIYKKGDRTRKIHHLVYVPSLAAADRLIQRLGRIGNLNADGRPILGLDSRHLLEIVLETDPAAYLIPAHIWTPWFAVMGSKSGFDSIEECYDDLTPHIFALETGLSSDPPMNWKISALDRYQLVSNSDAHSPGKIAREACLFDTEVDYFAIRHSLSSGEGYKGTVEFFPEEGKYHQDGCRKCAVSLLPDKTLNQKGLCPTCGKPVTVGVMHRVEKLADRKTETRPPNHKPFNRLVPLPELLSEIEGVGPKSKRVQTTYERLVNQCGSELYMLTEASVEELNKLSSSLLSEGIKRMREGRVICKAGYDGEYGVIRVFEKDEIKFKGTTHSFLFDLPLKTNFSSDKTEKGSQHKKDKAASVHDKAAFLQPPTKQKEQSHLRASENTIKKSVLDHLDIDQKAAAEKTEGPLLIIAGPGTGKTRTLTHRIAYLIEEKNVRPEACLAVTFTQRAANEMQERLEELLPTQGKTIPVMTFHALSFKILRENASLLGLSKALHVANEKEQVALLKEALQLTDNKARKLLKAISRMQREQQDAQEENNPILTKAFKTYQQKLKERNWIDFDNLISLALKLLASYPKVTAHYRELYRWISVDEYQDIDAQQYAIVQQLVADNNNLCAIGDPDQAIYGFRGADVGFFQRFTQDYPQAQSVILRQNYRSTKTIVEGALQVIKPSSLVPERLLNTINQEKIKITIHEAATDKAEAEYVVHNVEKQIGGSSFFSIDSGRVEGDATADYSFSDFAVLYRTDAQSDCLCEAFARSGIPFQKRSHQPLIEQSTLQALMEHAAQLSAEKVLTERLKKATHKVMNEPEQEDFMRLLNGPLEPIIANCDNNLERLTSMLNLQTEMDLLDQRADRVSLLTLHASKGLEFSVVFIVGCEDGLIPLCWDEKDKNNLDEERRLLFVGMTRARQCLFISHTLKRYRHGKIQKPKSSPFLKDLEMQLLKKQKTASRSRQIQRLTQQQLFNFSETLDDQ